MLAALVDALEDLQARAVQEEAADIVVERGRLDQVQSRPRLAAAALGDFQRAQQAVVVVALGRDPVLGSAS